MADAIYSVYCKEYYGDAVDMRFTNCEGFVLCDFDSTKYGSKSITLYPDELKVIIDAIKNNLTLFSLITTEYNLYLSAKINATNMADLKLTPDNGDMEMSFEVDALSLYSTLKYLYEQITEDKEKK